MPPLPKDVTLLGKFPTVQSIAEHAIGNGFLLPVEYPLTLLGCLLVAEHSYFLMQCGNHTWEEVLALAVEEYQTSNIQPAISKAVKAAFYDCNGNMDSLCEGVIKVVVENRMCKWLLLLFVQYLFCHVFSKQALDETSSQFCIGTEHSGVDYRYGECNSENDS
ncbi:hypothetical protein EDD16DRAFT_227388 [Pisolithus croceorrhizus]|nr:hypothetical protein EDD16DRAFT_227388 [Pisolithus croceorrhizus]